MTETSQMVFLITPRLGGLANDLLVETEDKKILYHVQAKLFAPLGQVYTILNENMQEILTTKEDHTIMFPCHTVLEKDTLVAKVGQLGFIPQNYFIEILKDPKLIIRIPVFESLFNLEGPHGVVAEIAQHRSTWIVAINTDQNYQLILALLAIVYREYSIGG
ncbi:MAG: hypothetical protein PHR77_13175 [Kiritimatiellae bacterium]|nr:hypothetical protein [Kiritimatiellia bacterium]MDD5520171.1 hypothetical protein [Kiritimatiellia bacterium]